MQLNDIADKFGARRARKRLGRGMASGTGKTAGKGHKGAKSRSGVAINGFEGGQMPIYRRLPKRGFNNIFRKHFQAVNVGRLQQAIDAGRLDAGKPIDSAVLLAAGVIRRPLDGVRLLANGELKASLTIEVAGASQAAIAAVEKAGGKVALIAIKVLADDTAKAEKHKAKMKKGSKAAAAADDA
ncbi:MAG: 50S ribosomal protein L15 [Alphaproteobacteria bacterium]|nr:50S ribosomal protein L15 [Alphaproteobacteria bacterium]